MMDENRGREMATEAPQGESAGAKESHRERMLKRLKERYPDKDFADDESAYGQIGEDYDRYDSELAEMRGREDKLRDMFRRSGKSAGVMADWVNGGDPVVSLVKHHGLEIRDVLDDPERQEEFAEAQKEYTERLAQSKALDEEWEREFPQTLARLQEFQSEKGLSDDEINAIWEKIQAIIGNGIAGKIDRDIMEFALKGMNYDADVVTANEEGEIAGRNQKIEERLRRSKRGDGMPVMDGKNGAGGGNRRGESIFDLAAQA